MFSFGNDSARNVVIFGVDNTSSCHTDNQKNNFLALSERPTNGVSDSIGAAEYSKYKCLLKFTLHWWWEFANLQIWGEW